MLEDVPHGISAKSGIDTGTIADDERAIPETALPQDLEQAESTLDSSLELVAVDATGNKELR
ncbi:MAG: hypothetical protein RLN69_05915, partial [Woeseiaceae bacterium]